MRLDRALIKQQAKQLIKGQVFILFFISLVVSILVGGVGVGSSIGSIGDMVDSFDNGNLVNEFDKGYFDNFTGDGSSPNLDYFNDFNGSVSLAVNRLGNNSFVYTRFNGLLTLALAPLVITLEGLFILVIRGRKFKVEDSFGYVFRETFNSNYFRKLGLYVVFNILLILLTCLFIIPGVIFYFKSYFAFKLLADNPNLSIRDALRLSKQMTNDHKGELFALEISFIGWYFLVAITCGLASIYVTPYVSATKALYYENFRIRALQEGRITSVDFMTEEEKAGFYQAQNQPQPVEEYYQPPQESFGSGMDTDYYNGNF